MMTRTTAIAIAIISLTIQDDLTARAARIESQGPQHRIGITDPPIVKSDALPAKQKKTYVVSGKSADVLFSGLASKAGDHLGNWSMKEREVEILKYMDHYVGEMENQSGTPVGEERRSGPRPPYYLITTRTAPDEAIRNLYVIRTDLITGYKPMKFEKHWHKEYPGENCAWPPLTELMGKKTNEGDLKVGPWWINLAEVAKDPGNWSNPLKSNPLYLKFCNVPESRRSWRRSQRVNPQESQVEEIEEVLFSELCHKFPCYVPAIN